MGLGAVAGSPVCVGACAGPGAVRARLASARGGTSRAATGKLPPPQQRFQPGRLAGGGVEPPLRIMFPPDGARLELATEDGKPDPIALKVSGGAGPLTVLVNGMPLAAEPGPRTPFFHPQCPGSLPPPFIHPTRPPPASLSRLP